MKKIQKIFISNLGVLVCCIILMILVACLPLSPTEAIETSGIRQDNLPVVITTLESRQNYITYIKEKKDGVNEVWAINPETRVSTLIASGNRLYSKDWSPSGDYLLFADNFSLYIANANGSGILRVYEVKEKSFIAAWWLSDDIILFDVYVIDSNDMIWPPPRQYYVNIKNGERGQLYQESGMNDSGQYLIQGIIPADKSWIQINGFTGEVNIANLQGNITKILDGYNLRYPIGALGIEFVPEKKSIVFLAPQKDLINANESLDSLWEMPLSEKEPKLIVEETPNIQFYEYHISPNGRYLAYTYGDGSKYIISILNLQTYKFEYYWDFPYHASTPSFVWSPDSRFIAFPYANSESGTKPVTSFGIQVMDITNGSTKVLVTEDVVLGNWHYISR